MRKQIQNCLAILLLILIGGLVLGRSLNNEFLNWDDSNQVLNNPLIRRVSLHQVGVIFFTPVAVGGLRQYHPLVTLINALEYRFFGLDPFPYHLHNLIFHLLNGILVFFIFSRLTGRPVAAFFGALFFLIHPFQVQSVGWAAGRKDLQYTLFYLLAFISYLDYAQKRRAGLYLLSLLFFSLSFLSKSAAVTFPLVLVAYDYWRGRKLKVRLIAEKAPFFLLLVLGVVMTLRDQLAVTPGVKLHSEVACGNVLLAARSVVFYLGRSVFPLNLSPFYPWPDRVVSISSFYILPLLVLLTLLITAYRLSGRSREDGFRFDRSRPEIFGVLFFGVTILPISRLIPLGGNEVVAMRFIYLPIIGLCLLGTCRIPDNILTAGRHRGLLALLLIITGCFCALSFLNCRILKDSRSYWERVIKYYPGYDLAHHQLGLAHFQQSDYEGAVTHCSRAIEINPAIAYAYVIKGLAREKMGDYSGAELSFRGGIEVLRKMGREGDVEKVRYYLERLRSLENGEGSVRQ